MLTINLEQELLSIRKKNKVFKSYLADNEKYLKEASSLLSSDDDTQILERLGMNKNIERASNIKNIINKESEKFDPKLESRIFTHNQIKDLALKYALRFLPVEHYKGNIDPQLVTKVKEFEICNELALGNLLSGQYANNYNKSKCDKHNSFILAPAESFDLQDRPIDPLFFVKLYDGRYYLVHKWGNDLSIFRAIKGFAMRNWYQFTTSWLLTTIPIFYLLIGMVCKVHHDSSFVVGHLICSILLSLVTCVLSNMILHKDALFETTIFSENVWDSVYKKN